MNKSALITGASRGIGRAMAKAFAALRAPHSYNLLSEPSLYTRTGKPEIL